MPSYDPQIIIASPDAAFREHLNKAIQAIRWPSVDAAGGADALIKLDSLAGIEAIVLDRNLGDLDVDDLDISLRAHRKNLDVLLIDLNDGEICRSNRALVHSRSKELIWQLGRDEAAEETLPRAVVIGVKEPQPEMQQRDWIPLPGLIGNYSGMAELSRLVRLVAPRKTTVLITGETGTGKEVVAQAVHKLSPRSDGPFIAVNCAAIPDTLLESELFGYTRGAFTGAMQPKMGRIEAANGGTLFLDEIGELPVGLQAKLLRFLQEREVQRLGSNEVTKVDVRIVAATHVNLMRMDPAKSFRQDLYYRLAVFPVEVPALRDRGGDILLLARHFLADMCQKDGVETKEFAADVAATLTNYEWPGNVRELQHLIERAFILAQNEKALTLHHLPQLNSQNILKLA